MPSELITPADLQERAREILTRVNPPRQHLFFKAHPDAVKDWWTAKQRGRFRSVGTLLLMGYQVYEVTGIEEDYDSCVGKCIAVTAKEFTERPCGIVIELPVRYEAKQGSIQTQSSVQTPFTSPIH